MFQQTQKCSNCKLDIAIGNFDLHEIYCIRNNIQCKRCGNYFDKNDPTSHEEEFHNGTSCEYCNQIFQDITKHNCNNKPISCLHCNLNYPKDQIFQHENLCGSRTEKCDICKQFIMIRDFNKHTISCKPPQLIEKQERQSSQNKIEQKLIPQQQIRNHPQNYSYTNNEQNNEQKLKYYQPERLKPNTQFSAQQEIFGYEQQQQKLNEQKPQIYSQNRQPQTYQQQQQIKPSQEYKYKQKEMPLQPTNQLKSYEDKKYHYQQQISYPIEQKLPSAQLDYKNQKQGNKYYEQKLQQDNMKQEDQKYKQFSQNKNPQQLPQKYNDNKQIDNEIDYKALGLSKEEIEQQKAYLESIQNQRKQQQSNEQQKVQEYKSKPNFGYYK